MSISGGLEQSLVRGKSINCTTIQIFTKSNRQWAAKPITPQEAALFKKVTKETGIAPLVVHATYLINIASSNDDLHKKSVDALIMELDRCAQLGIPYLVVHPGSFGTGSKQEGLSRIIEGLTYIFNHSANTTMLLLENMAGQGNSVCDTFQELGFVLKNVHHQKRLGICFDTCHAFAAGYDLRSEESYKKVWGEFDTHIGLEHLKVIHLNDSKKDLGSHVDRHEDIGKGKIGLEGFKLLCNDPRFFNVPKILETPSAELEDYARNLQVLQSLINPT